VVLDRPHRLEPEGFGVYGLLQRLAVPTDPRRTKASNAIRTSYGRSALSVVDRNVMPVTAGGMVNARAPRAYRTRG
jgi:hypothetical protein